MAPWAGLLAAAEVVGGEGLGISGAPAGPWATCCTGCPCCPGEPTGYHFRAEGTEVPRGGSV